MTTMPRAPRLGQLRDDPAIRAALAQRVRPVINPADDRPIARHPKVWSTYKAACERVGHQPNAIWFSQTMREFDRREAQHELNEALAVHRSPTDRALLAALDAAIVRAEKRKPRPARSIRTRI